MVPPGPDTVFAASSSASGLSGLYLAGIDYVLIERDGEISSGKTAPAAGTLAALSPHPEPTWPSLMREEDTTFSPRQSRTVDPAGALGIPATCSARMESNHGHTLHALPPPGEVAGAAVGEPTRLGGGGEGQRSTRRSRPWSATATAWRVARGRGRGALEGGCHLTWS